MRSRVFMTIRVLLLRWMTAIKVHTHTHTHRDRYNLDVVWCGVAWPFYHTNTHCSYATLATGLPTAHSPLPSLASLAALIKLVLDGYYGCIAWHRLMCATRHARHSPLWRPLWAHRPPVLMPRRIVFSRPSP